MTKKEYHKQINKRFYEYVNQHFPNYELDFNEGYGYVYLICENKNDLIEYHQSRHDLCILNYATDKAKQDMLQMERYINENIIPYVNMVTEV